MDKGILLGTKTLVLIIRHYIRELSGVFSVCHACRIIFWAHFFQLCLVTKPDPRWRPSVAKQLTVIFHRKKFDGSATSIIW